MAPHFDAEQIRSQTHAQPDQMLSRRPTEFLATKPFELFLTHVRGPGHFGDRPRGIHRRGNAFPQSPKTWVHRGRPGE